MLIKSSTNRIADRRSPLVEMRRLATTTEPDLLPTPAPCCSPYPRPARPGSIDHHVRELMLKRPPTATHRSRDLCPYQLAKFARRRAPPALIARGRGLPRRRAPARSGGACPCEPPVHTLPR